MDTHISKAYPAKGNPLGSLPPHFSRKITIFILCVKYFHIQITDLFQPQIRPLEESLASSHPRSVSLSPLLSQVSQPPNEAKPI